MLKNLSILLVAALVCALPFLLRPARDAGEWREGDPVLVVVSPHIASIREEFARGFSRWHAERFGRPVQIDWRNIGGTTEIMRYLQGEYESAYRAWRRRSGLPPADGALAARHPDDPAAAAAWDECRAHDDPADFGCKIDVFFGGGTYDHGAAESQGFTVPPWSEGEVPAGLFEDADGATMIPEALGGEVWLGRAFFSAVLSGFGICANPDRLVELGVTNADGTARQPRAWRDLADPCLVGQVAVTDPTKSGSIAKAFEMILHSTCRDHVLAAGFAPEQIEANEAAIREGREAPFADASRKSQVASPATRDLRPATYQQTVEDGWLEGIHLLQRIGANARYFTDAAGKPPQDVSAGDAAAGVCIDFYGRVQAETTRTADGVDRLLYVTPRGGSSISGDPISLLRGADHRELGARFIEFVLSEDGQKLWNGKPGTPGGPEKHALRRLPIRRDFYPNAENPAIDARAKARAGTTSDDLLDPAVDAYELAHAFTYEPRWTSAHFSFLRSFVRAMCMDSGEELRAAWRAILAHGGPDACPEAMRLLERMPDEPYAVNWANVTAARKDKSMLKGLSQTDLQTEWTKFFRRSYREAREAAERRE